MPNSNVNLNDPFYNPDPQAIVTEPTFRPSPKISTPHITAPQPGQPLPNFQDYTNQEQVVTESSLTGAYNLSPGNNYNPADPSYYTNPNQVFDSTPGVTPDKANGSAKVGAKMQQQLHGLGQNKLLNRLRKNWWIVACVLILIVSLGIAATFASSLFAGPKADLKPVTGEITAESRTPSGSLATWKIKVENNNAVKLDKVKVFLKFDNTFAFSRSLFQTPSSETNTTYGSVYDLGQLQPYGTGGSTALISIEGSLTGSLDTEAVMGGRVDYQPVGSRQLISTDLKVASTKISSPELTIDLTTAPQIKNGTEQDVYIDFRNSSDKPLSDLRIKTSYPSSDFYISSELQLSKTSEIQRQPNENDNIWIISQLPRFTPQQLKIRGRFAGVPGEVKTLKVEIAAKNPQGTDYVTLAQKNRTVTITGDILEVTAKIINKDTSKTFTQDDTLSMEINYKNTSTRNIENVKILGWLEDPADILDYTSVAYGGGDRGNYNNGKFEWTQSGAPQLRLVPPNGTGKLNFNIRVKKDKDFLNGRNQTDFTLRPRAILSAQSTDDVSVVGDEYKAAGSLQFKSDVQYQQPLPASNQPTPTNSCSQQKRLVEGQPCSLLVTWTITNSQNNVNNVTVRTRTTLPSVSATSPWDQTSILPVTENNNLSYDKNTGEIIWKVGNVAGYTGIIKPARTISFVITFTPSTTQINGGNVNLYEKVEVRGTDDFTLQTYQLDGNPAVAGR